MTHNGDNNVGTKTTSREKPTTKKENVTTNAAATTNAISSDYLRTTNTTTRDSDDDQPHATRENMNMNPNTSRKWGHFGFTKETILT